MYLRHRPTCDNGINGGQKAMSAALVPGRILRVELSSSPAPRTFSASWPNESPTDGDCGPIWTSVNGGGLGRRGELDGETLAAVMARGQGAGGGREARDETRVTGKSKGVIGDSAPSIADQ